MEFWRVYLSQGYKVETHSLITVPHSDGFIPEQWVVLSVFAVYTVDIILGHIFGMRQTSALPHSLWIIAEICYHTHVQMADAGQKFKRNN